MTSPDVTSFKLLELIIGSWHPVPQVTSITVGSMTLKPKPQIIEQILVLNTKRHLKKKSPIATKKRIPCCASGTPWSNYPLCFVGLNHQYEQLGDETAGTAARAVWAPHLSHRFWVRLWRSSVQRCAVGALPSLGIKYGWNYSLFTNNKVTRKIGLITSYTSENGIWYII